MPAPWKLAHASTRPATTGMPASSRRWSAAAGVSSPRTSPARTAGGTFAAGTPAPSSTAAAGNGWPSTRLVAARPVSRSPRKSHVARYQHVAAATAGSFRSTQSAAGSPASDQPARPVAAASSAASAVARESCQMIAGRVGRPAASTATSVGPWPSTATAMTSAAAGDVSRRTDVASAPHHASGSCSARPVAASVSVR